MSTPAEETSTGPRGREGPRRARGRQKKSSAPPTAGAGSKAAKIHDEVYLVVSIAATGRTPLNGWVLSIGAVAIAAESRRVLGMFARNVRPLLSHVNIEPAADVAGYLRRQRAELELFYRRGSRVTAEAMMRDLRAFCEPYANLTLVGSPLFSVHGWLSYYWSYAFPASAAGEAPPPMPWGFSGLCARSYTAGRLGVPVRKLATHPAYQASTESYMNIGVPLGDALVAAVSFTHLAWRVPTAHTGEGAGEGAAGEPPAVTFACTVPALLGERGCIPLGAVAAAPIRWTPCLPGCEGDAMATSSGAAPGLHHGQEEAEGEGVDARVMDFPARRSMLACVVDRSIVDGLTEPPHVEFTEYPSITDCVHHPNFLDRLPAALVGEHVEWVATEKVHGSNLTIFCDGVRLWAAKRTGYVRLDDSSAFFDFVYLIEEARPALMRAYALVVEWLTPPSAPSPAPSSTMVVAFVCELAGGVYPHPAVPVDLRGVRVQNGVYYSPKNFLYGFDIAVELSKLPAAFLEAERQRGGHEDLSYVGRDGRYYLPFDEASRIFREAGFEAYARALHRGPLHELLALGVEFPSTVADTQLGLPAITSCANEAEGYVVRPVRDAWVRVDEGSREASTPGEAAPPVWARAMVKRKHPRFDEFAFLNTATTVRAHAEQARTAGAGDTTVDLATLLTAGRVESVLSKYTAVERGDHARMVAAVLADALKDAKSFPQR